MSVSIQYLIHWEAVQGKTYSQIKDLIQKEWAESCRKEAMECLNKEFNVIDTCPSCNVIVEMKNNNAVCPSCDCQIVHMDFFKN
jgi:rubrerythrin